MTATECRAPQIAQYDLPFSSQAPAFDETQPLVHTLGSEVTKLWCMEGRPAALSTWPSGEGRPPLALSRCPSEGESRIQISASSCYDAGDHRASYEFVPSGSYEPPLSISQSEKRNRHILNSSQRSRNLQTLKRETDETTGFYNLMSRPSLSRRAASQVFLDDELVEESFR